MKRVFRFIFIFSLFLTIGAGTLHAFGQREDRYAEIDRLIEERNYNQALVKLKNILKTNPDDFDNVQQRIDRIMLAQENYSKLTMKLVQALNDPYSDDGEILELFDAVSSFEQNPNKAIQSFLDKTEGVHEFFAIKNSFSRIVEEARVLFDRKLYADSVHKYCEALDIYYDQFLEESSYNLIRDDIVEIMTTLRGWFDESYDMFNQICALDYTDQASGSVAEKNTWAADYLDLILQTAEQTEQTGLWLEKTFQTLNNAGEISNMSWLSFAYRTLLGSKDFGNFGIVDILIEEYEVARNCAFDAAVEGAEIYLARAGEFKPDYLDHLLNAAECFDGAAYFSANDEYSLEGSYLCLDMNNLAQSVLALDDNARVYAGLPLSPVLVSDDTGCILGKGGADCAAWFADRIGFIGNTRKLVENGETVLAGCSDTRLPVLKNARAVVADACAVLRSRFDDTEKLIGSAEKALVDSVSSLGSDAELFYARLLDDYEKTSRLFASDTNLERFSNAMLMADRTHEQIRENVDEVMAVKADLLAYGGQYAPAAEKTDEVVEILLDLDEKILASREKLFAKASSSGRLIVDMNIAAGRRMAEDLLAFMEYTFSEQEQTFNSLLEEADLLWNQKNFVDASLRLEDALALFECPPGEIAVKADSVLEMVESFGMLDFQLAYQESLWRELSECETEDLLSLISENMIFERAMSLTQEIKEISEKTLSLRKEIDSIYRTCTDSSEKIALAHLRRILNRGMTVASGFGFEERVGQYGEKLYADSATYAELYSEVFIRKGIALLENREDLSLIKTQVENAEKLFAYAADFDNFCREGKQVALELEKIAAETENGGKFFSEYDTLMAFDGPVPTESAFYGGSLDLLSRYSAGLLSFASRNKDFIDSLPGLTEYKNEDTLNHPVFGPDARSLLACHESVFNECSEKQDSVYDRIAGLVKDFSSSVTGVYSASADAAEEVFQIVPSFGNWEIFATRVTEDSYAVEKAIEDREVLSQWRKVFAEKPDYYADLNGAASYAYYSLEYDLERLLAVKDGIAGKAFESSLLIVRRSFENAKTVGLDLLARLEADFAQREADFYAYMDEGRDLWKKGLWAEATEKIILAMHVYTTESEETNQVSADFENRIREWCLTEDDFLSLDNTLAVYLENPEAENLMDAETLSKTYEYCLNSDAFAGSLAEYTDWFTASEEDGNRIFVRHVLRAATDFVQLLEDGKSDLEKKSISASEISAALCMRSGLESLESEEFEHAEEYLTFAQNFGSSAEEGLYVLEKTRSIASARVSFIRKTWEYEGLLRDVTGVPSDNPEIVAFVSRMSENYMANEEFSRVGLLAFAESGRELSDPENHYAGVVEAGNAYIAEIAESYPERKRTLYGLMETSSEDYCFEMRTHFEGTVTTGYQLANFELDADFVSNPQGTLDLIGEDSVLLAQVEKNLMDIEVIVSDHPDLVSVCREMLESVKGWKTEFAFMTDKASSQLLLAGKARKEGDLRYQEAKAAYDRQNYSSALSLIQKARAKYTESLLYSDSESLRIETDEKLSSLGVLIARAENQKVVSEVRTMKTQAKNEYYAGNFENAERILLQAKNRWAATNADEDAEITSLLGMVGTALAMKTGRTLSVTSPLYSEVSQMLSIANQFFIRGKKMSGGTLTDEARDSLLAAKEKIQAVQVVFPLNQEASLMSLRIEQLLNPENFAVYFAQRAEEAMAAWPAAVVKQTVYVDLIDLYEINPGYPGLGKFIENAEIELGIRVVPPDTTAIEESRTLYRQALALFNAGSRDEISLRNALSRTDEALSKNPDNEDAQILKDRINIAMGGTGTIILPAEAEMQYQKALQELQKGNIVQAAAIVTKLMQNETYRKSVKLIDLKKKVDALL